MRYYSVVTIQSVKQIGKTKVFYYVFLKTYWPTLIHVGVYTYHCAQPWYSKQYNTGRGI